VQALEKIIYSNNWITILLVVLLSCIFLLKAINTNKLKTIVYSFFNKSYITTEVENRTSYFTGFNFILFIFIIINLSLFLYFVQTTFYKGTGEGFILFIKILFGTSIYFIIKWFLEYLIAVLFLIKSEIRYFVVSKSMYIYAVTFFLYIAIILITYTSLNTVFLSYFGLSLFLIRFVFHVMNNKNLILSKLFYFILYLCTFEIAPLFILFKFMF